MSPVRSVLATACALTALTAPTLAAQTRGQIVGVVRSAQDSSPVADVDVGVTSGPWRATTGPSGEFVLVGLPPGRYTVRARRLGFQPTEVRGVRVRSGASARLAIYLQPSTIQLEGITVVAPDRPLLSPGVTAGRQVVSRAELESAPIEDIEQVLELRTGISEGHFRGGRVGQEAYVIDGIDVKDQFQAARSGIAFQLAPSAVQEVSVFTSGFSADQASAVSGVVNMVSRSGPRDRWIGRLAFVSDDWAPGDIRRGYARAGASAGGPLIGGITGFFDLTAFGRADQNPRVEGLTCLDVDFPCPARRAIIPHQEGDRYFAFGKLDIPLGGSFNAELMLNRTRDQRELYSTRFKYALAGYLAERETATLASFAINGTFRVSPTRAFRITSRVSIARLDRYLGVLDTAQSGRIGRFRWGDFRFRGESFTRNDVDEQIATGLSVPGYVQPSDSGTASPYGVFGADLFVTDGTSGIAEWSQSDFMNFRLDMQTLVSPQHDLKIGGDLKLYRVATYQHVAAALAGAAPNFVRFYPRTAAVYFHNTLYTLDAATIDLGARVEAFQPRLAASRDRRDLTAPIETTDWRVIIHPRVGFAIPLSILGLDRAAAHWNFGRFSQPPDFQFFFDQALDDSLNTAVRRQGNPNLGFERAVQYEAGIDWLLTNDAVLRITGFLKELSGLTTSGIALVAQPGTLFTNLDFGRVSGLEVRVETRQDDGRRLEIGYALQRAVGVVSTAFDSTSTPGRDITDLEVPLQFDRRHAINLNAFWPVPAGFWLSIGGSIGSGLPNPGAADERLPWSVAISARLTRNLAWGSRRVRFIAEGRNLLNYANLVTARTAGGVMPNVAALESQALGDTQGGSPIPRESPLYIPGFDLDDNGFLGVSEQRAARRAALLDFNEPTLLFGEARQVRLGIEVVF